jgi:probable DNA repair protein
MPRACPERELQLSRQLFDLFTRSGAEIIFSYSVRDGDIHLQPAALLNTLDAIDLPSSDGCHPWQGIIANSGALEIVDDSLAPPFAPPDGRVRGGSRLLADQAGCPFNAVAQWRLGAEALAEPQTGLRAQLRGILVHDSLDIFWHQLGSQKALLALADSERQRQLEQAVAQAFTRVFSHNSLITRADFGERLLDLEKQRLLSLLDQWLQLEVARPGFTVAAAEKNLPFELGGLTLSLRVDRIDKLDSIDTPDGDLAIIDYKTGKTGISTVAAERLTEPQLPLYALAVTQAMGQTPAAVSYALINRKTLGFDGIASTDALISGCKSLAERQLPEDWPATLEQWREKLNVLIAELRTGRADVTFYHRSARDYGGHLEPLNRLAGGDDLNALKQRLNGEQKGVTP